MHYYSKSVYEQYSNLALGKYDNPYEVLKDSFQVEYGYTRKEYPLYQQIIDDDRFQIIFEDNEGLIFRLS